MTIDLVKNRVQTRRQCLQAPIICNRGDSDRYFDREASLMRSFNSNARATPRMRLQVVTALAAVASDVYNNDAKLPSLSVVSLVILSKNERRTNERRWFCN